MSDSLFRSYFSNTDGPEVCGDEYASVDFDFQESDDGMYYSYDISNQIVANAAPPHPEALESDLEDIEPENNQPIKELPNIDQPNKDDLNKDGPETLLESLEDMGYVNDDSDIVIITDDETDCGNGTSESLGSEPHHKDTWSTEEFKAITKRMPRMGGPMLVEVFEIMMNGLTSMTCPSTRDLFLGFKVPLFVEGDGKVVQMPSCYMILTLADEYKSLKPPSKIHSYETNFFCRFFGEFHYYDTMGKMKIYEHSYQGNVGDFYKGSVASAIKACVTSLPQKVLNTKLPSLRGKPMISPAWSYEMIFGDDHHEAVVSNLKTMNLSGENPKSIRVKYDDKRFSKIPSLYYIREPPSKYSILEFHKSSFYQDSKANMMHRSNKKRKLASPDVHIGDNSGLTFPSFTHDQGLNDSSPSKKTRIH